MHHTQVCHNDMKKLSDGDTFEAHKWNIKSVNMSSHDPEVQEKVLSALQSTDKLTKLLSVANIETLSKL